MLYTVLVDSDPPPVSWSTPTQHVDQRTTTASAAASIRMEENNGL